ncbi:MAG: hypothetical protein K0U64_09075 [Actinomycetia bacterium]|nr:hypothetical protein [Actinomycetes bacterium]
MIDWRSFAELSWEPLLGSDLAKGFGSVRIREVNQRRGARLSDLSHLLMALAISERADVATGRLKPDLVWRAVARYRRGPGYGERPRIGRIYYADNAWLGLAAAQEAGLVQDENPAAMWWRRAEESMRFVDSGVLREGGVGLRLKSEQVSGTASAAAGCLALSLQQAPRGAGDRWQFLARDVATFEEHTLRRSDGLLAYSPGAADRQAPSPTDQGLGVLLRLGLGQEQAAADLVAAILSFFDARRLWSEPPIKTAVMLRSLMRYSAQTADSAPLAYVDEFLQRLWWQGRDSQGWFVGLPASPKPSLSAQAAWAGVLAARATRPELRAQLW